MGYLKYSIDIGFLELGAQVKPIATYIQEGHDASYL